MERLLFYYYSKIKYLMQVHINSKTERCVKLHLILYNTEFFKGNLMHVYIGKQLLQYIALRNYIGMIIEVDYLTVYVLIYSLLM